MNTHMLSTVLAAAFALLLPATTVTAQPTQFFRTYVSEAGADANDCFSLQTPCRTFGRAHEQTADFGQISCLTSGHFVGFFGPTRITKSITIDCAGTSATACCLIVDGPGIVVTIRNLRLFFGVIGIDFQNGNALFVENATISLFAAGDTPLGIRFQPLTPRAQLVVSDTIIDTNGILLSGAGGGIEVAPQPGGSAMVVLNRVHLAFNVTAMVLNSSGGTIRAAIRDSVVSSRFNNGIMAIAPAVAAPVRLNIERSSLVNNGIAVQSNGANSLVRIGGSQITGNQTGLSAVGGGQILSYQNNEINGNDTDGAPTGVLALK
jgi:hypothetical protein